MFRLNPIQRHKMKEHHENDQKNEDRNTKHPQLNLSNLIWLRLMIIFFSSSSICIISSSSSDIRSLFLNNSLDHRRHQTSHISFPFNLILSGVSGQYLDGDKSSHNHESPRPPSYQSTGGAWISEELWPKEKSLIHVKLIKPVPKEIEIWGARNKDNYLSDLNLDFESPYRTLSLDNCTLDFRSYYDGYNDLPNNADLLSSVGNIQLQISGGLNCTHLPFHVLSREEKENLTHVVIRDTGLRRIPRFIFGAARLERLLRMDLIANRALTDISSRAFDGLTRLSYLSLINNVALRNLDVESFAGVKSLEELIFIGNGNWSGNLFKRVLESAAERILPNLVHLHICASVVGGVKVAPVILSDDPHHPNDNGTREKAIRADHNHGDDDVRDYERSSSEGHPDDQPLLISNDTSSINGKKQQGQMSTLSQLKNNSEIRIIRRKEKNEITSIKYGLIDQNYISTDTVKINKDDLRSLSQIKYLQLSDSSLGYIHPLAFLPLTKKLIGLNLGGNDKLDVASLKRALSVFQEEKGSLEKLDVSNSITGAKIPKDLLVVISKTNISELYFNGVEWKSISSGDLPPMPKLKVLHIDRSQIETIGEDVFTGFDNLNKLSFRANLMTEMPLNLLEPLPKLHFLDISGYKRHELPDAALQRLRIPRKFFIHGTKLREVNLSYKDLDPLPRNFFLGLFKAEKVHLRGCGLKFIEYLTFFPLQSIAYIDLSENEDLIASIRETHEDTFVGLEAVQMVRMSDCNITSRDLNDFNIFKRIQEHVSLLDLSHNHIENISRTSFGNFTELRHLDLSYNKIKSWSASPIFSKNQFMTTLDISHNSITHLTAEMLGDFRRLKNLSFAHNPFECDCLWRGPLLLLNQNNKKSDHLLARNFHEQIEQQLQSLVKRQQEIVTEAFSSPDQAPPESVIDWLNTTNIHFLKDRHPLRSKGHYFCHVDSSGKKEQIVFKDFFERTCSMAKSLRGKVSFALLSVIAAILLLFTTVVLVIAFFYYSTLRSIFTMVEDDFLHNYDYDAFVSFNRNDLQWVFQKLIPNLEEHHDHHHFNHFSSSKEKVSTVTSSCHQTSSSNNKIKLCVYERDFIAGRNLTECITEAIKNSRKVILVISNNFIQSQWCRFETDVAHNILMDQNREGLILVKIEDVSIDTLESVAPQLHFLLKTRIYLDWSESNDLIFWKKLRRALGFPASGPYGTVKQYYQNYWFSKSEKSSYQQKKEYSHHQLTPSTIVTIPSSLSPSSPVTITSASCSTIQDDRDKFVPQVLSFRILDT